MLKSVFVIHIFVLLIPIIHGLQCPSCTYITSDANIPALARTIIDGILNLFQDPECANDLKKPTPEIKEETCDVVSGKVSRCSYYKGRITLTIPLVVTNVEVPLQIYQRGCYHSKPANVPAIGCHRRQDINEDTTIIKQLLNKASSTFKDYGVADFEGEMCMCIDTYCKLTSGSVKTPVISPLLLAFSSICLFLLKF
ncbi:hypothetical protein ACF0H5_019284 [Mactra antiquata]